MEFNTICVHGSSHSYDKTGSVSVPIFQTATFAHPGVGQSTGYDYSRVQNPTREYLEETMARLEQGKEALAFSSGMAAISAVMELFSPVTTLFVPMICTAARTACFTISMRRTVFRSRR